jgi:hypothetical protein
MFLKQLYSIMNLNTISLQTTKARPKIKLANYVWDVYKWLFISGVSNLCLSLSMEISVDELSGDQHWLEGIYCGWPKGFANDLLLVKKMTEVDTKSLLPLKSFQIQIWLQYHLHLKKISSNESSCEFGFSFLDFHQNLQNSILCTKVIDTSFSCPIVNKYFHTFGGTNEFFIWYC